MEILMNNEHVDIVLLSSVLPYLEKPYDVLQEIVSFGVRHMVIDRTPFLLSGNRDRLTVQKVPSSIYKASYPAWFFNKQKFMDFIQRQYRITAVYDNSEKANIRSEFKGFILERY